MRPQNAFITIVGTNPYWRPAIAKLPSGAMKTTTQRGRMQAMPLWTSSFAAFTKSDMSALFDKETTVGASVAST